MRPDSSAFVRISQYVTGKLEPSTAMLDRLLPMLGVQVSVSVTPVRMERTKYRSWLLHREVLRKTRDGLSDEDWVRLGRTPDQVRVRAQGPRHLRNIDRWQRNVDERDLDQFRRVLTDGSDDGIGMREVSPVTGFLTDEERLSAIRDSWRGAA